MCLVSINSLLYTLCVPLFPIYTTYIRHSRLTTNHYSAYNLFTSTNTWSIDLYSGDFQISTVLFTRNFTWDGLNYYLLPSTLSCLLIVQHNHYNERTWSRTFVFLPFRALLLINFCLYIMYASVALAYIVLSYSY